MSVFASMPKGVRTVLETAITLAVALAIAWLAQAFIIKPYRVPTPSMVPTLLPGDRVLADRLTLDFGTPHRYQIGLPGETLWSQDGKIWVQDGSKPKFSLNEPYVNDHQEVAGRALQKVTIPK